MKTSIIFCAGTASAFSSPAEQLLGSSGTWTSPGYPGYPSGAHNRYFKALGPNEVLILEFEHLDIEYDPTVSFYFRSL